MLSIQAYNSCIHVRECPHSENCQGADANRGTVFNCSFYDNGKFVTNEYRNPNDKTGKMKVLYG